MVVKKVDAAELWLLRMSKAEKYIGPRLEGVNDIILSLTKGNSKASIHEVSRQSGLTSAMIYYAYKRKMLGPYKLLNYNFERKLRLC